LRHTSFGIIVCLCLSTHAVSQEKTTALPTNDQINLVSTQAERATAQYEYSIKVEELTLGNLTNGESAIKKDREVLNPHFRFESEQLSL
jgi:hypothetical protein